MTVAPLDRGRRFAVLTALYFTQGLPFGFFQNALPVILRQRGYPIALISLGALLALPWAFKFLIAPLVDRYGARRDWLLPLQVVLILVVTLAAGFDPIDDIGVVLVVVLVSNLVSAVQDVPSDGLAVDLLPVEERGFGNGLQVAAYRAGMIVGGGVLLVVYGVIGWGPTLIVLATLLVGATLVVAMLAPRTRVQQPDPAPYASMLAFVLRPGIAPWLGLLAAYKAGESFGVNVVRSFLVDRGLSIEAIGLVLGVGGFAAGLAGALVGGLVAGRVGARRALIGFAGLQAVAVASYAVPAGGIGGDGAVVAAALFEHFASGTATAALFTAMMDASSRRTAATDYTVQACVVVFSTIVAGAASGASAKVLGYPTHFLVAAGLCLAVVALAGRIGAPRGRG